MVRDLDGQGRWDQAVAAATSPAGVSAASPNTTFEAFATASSVVGLLVGLVAAASSWWGVSQRLEEYR